MKVFKFGGASVKDARGIKNVATILQSYPETKLIVVISAMGKTTNALERTLSLYNSHQNYQAELDDLRLYHDKIIKELFPASHPLWNDVKGIFQDLEDEMKKQGDADLIYDQVVSFGEVLSTVIVHQYLKEMNINATWIDARDYIATDSTFREGRVDWKKTSAQVRELAVVLEKKNVVITQGFIGRSPGGLTTTLGRDGSDFSAAIFASTLGADSVTIWKDVPGVMNADPKRLPAATVFEELPFREAAEMTYYGASVIHPKTIKPLANKSIPLFVKNFDDPSLPGTKIHECHVDHLPPLIVFKDNQCLISCKVTDYTFVSEDQMSHIFNTLSELNVRI
ncbi:MAG: aspartate kinase, partial [Bacteroidota bacterium]